MIKVSVESMNAVGTLHSVYIALPLKIEGYIEFLVVSVPQLVSPGTTMWQMNTYSCKELRSYLVTMFGWLVQILIAVLQPDELWM